jgi:D-hydroxyproline dehydrogenase subunit beta
VIPDVIVVGGGIAGTTVAWELARRGTRVELFEQATLAARASGRNTGTLLHQVEPVVAAMLRESEERGVLTDAGPVAAGAVIAATGPWLTELLPLAPMKPGRGWLMRTQRLDFDVPWIVEEVSWPDQAVLGAAASPTPLADLAAGHLDQPIGECFLLCPLPDGDAFVGASLSTSLRDAVEGIHAPQRMAARALEVAPGLAESVGVTRAWWGLRPMTPDGLPLAGPTETDGLLIHGGHASLGMQAAPATAAWLAAWMHGEQAPSAFDELRPDRFTTTRSTT